MRYSILITLSAILITGCTSSGNTSRDPAGENTTTLCRDVSAHPDANYRARVANILAKRGADAAKCNAIIAADNAMAAGIALTAVAVAAAHSGGGGYYGGRPYGVVWDQFYNQYYQLIWRCRDMATGRFVEDYYCAGKVMTDTTWPGWRA